MLAVTTRTVAATRQALTETFRKAGIDSADADARLLIAHALGIDRAALIASSEHALNAKEAKAIDALAERRLKREPVARIFGIKEFWSLPLHISPAVLVPRPETEGLVEWALERLAAVPAGDVVDLGTGSGAVALAVKQAQPHAAVCASDASLQALTLARANSARLGLEIEFAEGDWWQPWAGRRFGLALSNPPYVAAGDPHLRDLTHEPQCALTSGEDGLDALRCIVAGAPAHLLPGAWLLLEHSHDQAEAVQALLRQAGFAAPETRPDLAGLPRCTGAAWPGAK